MDFEATGINASRDRIIQYGIYGVDHHNKLLARSAVVDAQCDTGRDPFLIPGVTKSDVHCAKPLWDGHLDVLYEACHRAIVICHKREFDWNLLEAEFRRHGRTPPKPYRVECTIRLSRTDIGVQGPHTLQALCQQFNIPLVLAHNALHDAKATFRLYIILLNKYPEAFSRDLWMVCSKYWAPLPWIRFLSFTPMPALPSLHKLLEYKHP